MRWFRYYDDALNDPKVQKLSDKLFKFWINVLCIASKNDGVLPSVREMSFATHLSETKVAERLKKLKENGLLDENETGITPHNWEKRQYKSDDPTERVKRFRNGKRNVSETVSETGPETDTESEQNRTESPLVPPGGRKQFVEEGRKALVHIEAGTPQWDAWKLKRGKPFPRDKNNGWMVPSEYPPS